MTIQIQVLLDKFDLLHPIITFVKDEGTNLSGMAATLYSIINYEPLKILKVQEGTCFGHAMSKACQYATNDEKVYVGLRNVNVKEVQSGLQKTITWTKKFGKWKQEWEWACFENAMGYGKLKAFVKTKFASKVITFQETLKFKNAIIFYYSKQKSIALQQKVLKAQVWTIAEAIASTLNLVVYACVMNQTRGHQLLSRALTTSITFSMEMEVQQLELSIGLEISYLFETKICLMHRNMRLEVIKVIKPILDFLRSYM